MSSEIDLAPDVLVIGGGIAGAMAAARARESGLTVALVAKIGGGTMLSSGAIDIADEFTGLVPGPAHDPFERGGRWRKAIGLVAARAPRHPYARAGAAGRDRMREAIALLRELARGPAAGGFEGRVDLVERDDGANHVVATQLGTIKRAALVQRSQLLDVAALDADIVGIVEPQDLAGFSARSTAHMLSWIMELGGRRVQLVPVVVARTLGGRELFSSTSHMARHLDHAPARAAFCNALSAALREQPLAPAHLLLPPILGIERPALVHAEVEHAAGRPVRELLAQPPSAPGERLARALIASLKARGVAVIEGAAVAASARDLCATSVVVEGPQLRLELRPRAVVLAAGRFLSGGIVRDGVAREVLFGLAVVANGAIVGDRFIGDFTGQTPDGEHAIFRSGVAVDDEQRPLDERGRVALTNVACAGSLLEGWDPARDGSGAGASALSGFLAGERVASWEKSK